MKSKRNKSLIEQGVIAEAGRGKVVFDMPMFRAYLMERS